MKKIIIPVKGLHCRSCETLVKEKLEAVDGVKSAEVSVKNSVANIELNKEVKQEALSQFLLSCPT